MNKLNTLSILVNSMSKAEKRSFRLIYQQQGKDKVYLYLFDLLQKDMLHEEITNTFKKKYKGKNFESAVKHLYNVILESLLISRDSFDTQQIIFNHITKANILFERGLHKEAFATLYKAKEMALKCENEQLAIIIQKNLLTFHSTLNFGQIGEKELISMQFEINSYLKYAQTNIHHLQLYNVLRYRLNNKGYIRSDKHKNDLNDLILSEVNLVANGSYQGFEADKLHSLFQATYYLNSGNTELAVRYYKNLVSEYEKKGHLIQNPPLYYISAIYGVLDSLLTSRVFNESDYFISKLEELAGRDYSKEFKMDLYAQIFIYKSTIAINKGMFSEAERIFSNYEEIIFKKISLYSPDLQLKLIYQQALIYFSQENYSAVRRILKKIFMTGKMWYNLPVFREIRLLNLLIQAELGNHEFLTNEIGSFKRYIEYEKQIFLVEKLIFRFIQDYPLPVYEKNREKLWSKYESYITPIINNKYELILTKNFNFVAWIESKIKRVPFSETICRFNESINSSLRGSDVKVHISA
jgi:hypothetical protein